MARTSRRSKLLQISAQILGLFQHIGNLFLREALFPLCDVVYLFCTSKEQRRFIRARPHYGAVMSCCPAASTSHTVAEWKRAVEGQSKALLVAVQRSIAFSLIGSNR
jgi:hypothetical protein